MDDCSWFGFAGGSGGGGGVEERVRRVLLIAKMGDLSRDDVFTQQQRADYYDAENMQGTQQ